MKQATLLIEVIREMASEPQWDIILLNKMAITEMADNHKCWQGWGEIGALLCRQWTWKMVQPLCKSLAVPRNGRHSYGMFLVTCSPAPSIYLRGMKIYVYTQPWTWTFIATLFIIAREWKQPASKRMLIHAKCMLISAYIKCDTSMQWNIIWQ